MFVDESKRGDYIMVAVAALSGDLDSARLSLRGLLLPGQGALHFKNEQDGRRRTLLAAFTHLPLTARVYVSRGSNEVASRRACLEALASDLRPSVERLVLEQADGDLAADRRTLFAAQRKHAATWSYVHQRAPQEPILWVADVAWAWSRGGPWRASISGLITSTGQV